MQAGRSKETNSKPCIWTGAVRQKPPLNAENMKKVKCDRRITPLTKLGELGTYAFESEILAPALQDLA